MLIFNIDLRILATYNYKYKKCGGKMKKRLACVLALIIMIAANSGGVMPTFALTVAGEGMEVEEGDLYTDYDVSTWGEILEVVEDDPENCARLNFTSDITKEVGDARLQIPEDKYVEMNLNGHTLSLMSNNTRGLANYGDLVITGNGIINNGTEVSGAYGLIDNYGSITIENGTFIDYGEGDGSSIKNRPGYGASLVIEAGTFEGRGVNTGNACVYSDGVLIISDGVSFISASNRAYAVIVNSGRASIGETVGVVDNPVIVDGTHGGLGVNGGSVVVNNGVYSAKNYYAIWITNNDGMTDVDIKYGEFNGNLYGLRAGVDDGHQDASDADIRIEGGKFYGGTKAAIALNAASSERDWGLTISGGEYSTEPNKGYLAEDYVAGKTIDDAYPYMVVSETDESDQYDVEYEEDEETGEEVPIIYPSIVDYGDEESDGVKTSDESDYGGTIEFNESFIADRKAYVEIKENSEEITFSSDKTSAVVAFDIALRDRNKSEIEVKNNSLVVRIKLTDEQYEEIVDKEAIYVVYADGGKEIERIEARVIDGENGKKILEFETTHLSTFVLAYDSEEEELESTAVEIVSPETGTMTAAGASASVAALMTAVAVGILTSITSFAYLMRRRD